MVVVPVLSGGTSTASLPSPPRLHRCSVAACDVRLPPRQIAVPSAVKGRGTGGGPACWTLECPGGGVLGPGNARALSLRLNTYIHTYVCVYVYRYLYCSNLRRRVPVQHRRCVARYRTCASSLRGLLYHKIAGTCTAPSLCLALRRRSCSTCCSKAEHP